MVRSFPAIISPQSKDITIPHQRRPAQCLCPAQHPSLDKIIFAEDPGIPEQGCPDRVVPVNDRFLVPEIPFYPLEGEPVKFHGERGVEPECVGGIPIVGT